MEHTKGKITFVEAGAENDKGVVGRIDFPDAVAIVTHNPLESTHEDIVAVVNGLIKKADLHDELVDICKLMLEYIEHDYKEEYGIQPGADDESETAKIARQILAKAKKLTGEQT